MNTSVPAPALGTLGMLVTKVDDKMHFNTCMRFLAAVAGGTRAGEVCSSIWDTGPQQCFLRVDPNPQPSFWRQEDRDVLPTPNICPWHLVCGQCQLFAIDEANTRKAIKWSQKRNKVHPTQSCDSTGQRRGTQKVEGGRHLGTWGVWACMWVLRKVSTRNQLSNQFPKHWGENDATALLFFHWQAVCFSFVQESKIPIRWWNRTWK